MTLDWNSPRLQRAVVLALLGFFLLVSAFSVVGKTETYDEPNHYAYGVQILSGNSTRFDDSKMPFSALNALPGRIVSLLPPNPLSKVLNNFFFARLMTILFATLVAYLVFYWSRCLYGFLPALVSLLLFIFDPNIIAHSQLVTTDLYAVGTITYAFYCLWRFAQRRTLWNGMACALALGISQLAKYTAVALFPLFLLTLFLYDFPSLLGSLKLKAARAIKSFILKYLVYGALAIVVSILIINLGFLSNQTFLAFGDYQFRSPLFRTIQEKLPALHNVPVPVPYPYFQGIDWVVQHEITGHSYGPIYLLGVLHSQTVGFKGYYFVASFLKVPIATQILTGAALVIYLWDRKRRQNFLADEMFLLIPMIFFTIYFNFFYVAQIGIRYYLVVFPLLYIFTGHLFKGLKDFPVCLKASTLVLLAYLVISVLSYYPYFLSYFNEVVWNRTQAYKYLADSNLDWGEDGAQLERYLSAHPDALYAPDHPVGFHPMAGHLVIEVNDLVGITKNPQEYAWLRNNFEPVGTIAYSYLIYQISPQQISTLCASSDYCK